MPFDERQTKDLIILQAMSISKLLSMAGGGHDYITLAALKLLSFSIERTLDAKAKGQSIIEMAIDNREDVDLEIDFIYSEFKDKIKL